jgi:hypothetical protein
VAPASASEGTDTKSQADQEFAATPTTQPPNLMIWKDADGHWKWLGIYSNAFEDRHTEILSSTAHQDFEKAFDSGEWPVVELWPWHLPLPVGYGTLVSYDPVTKMAICAGEFVAGAESIAEAWSTRSDLGMSHGMPYSELKYNPNDTEVIDRYRSKEFTVLPLVEAANLLTDFSTYQEFSMPIPANKKHFLLESGLTEAQITALESKMQVKAAAGDALGLRFKELLTDEIPAPQTEAAAATPPVEPIPTADKSAAVPSDQDYNLADVVDALKEIGKRQQTDIATLRQEVDALRKEVAAGVLALSPKQSLTEILAKDIFGDDSPARVDGRTRLAKDGPLETKDAGSAALGGSFLSSAIDYMIDMSSPQ